MNTTGKVMCKSLAALLSYCEEIGCPIAGADIKNESVSRLERRHGEFTFTFIIYRRKNGLWWVYWAKDNHAWREAA